MKGLIKIASDLDVNPLLEQLSEHSTLWTKDTFRQRYPGTAHSDTESIYLRWALENTAESIQQNLTSRDCEAFDIFTKARKLVKQVMELTESNELGRVLLVRLKPNGRILPHSDEGLYSDHFERFHLSLKSELGNYFYVGKCAEECAYMPEGSLWSFNHKNIHWALNMSQAPRIHMIIDTVSPKYRRMRVL